MTSNNDRKLLEPKCKCGAYAKPELRHRTGHYLCCSRCYDDSWSGISDQEWEAAEMGYGRTDRLYDDD